jgi:hypothetical protein
VTDVRHPTGFDHERARRQVERGVGVANVVVGLALTLGSLAFAVEWRVQYGGFAGLRAFYLHTAWWFGALELVAGTAMVRRWPARWIFELLPLVVPIVAYQYFILHFIFHRI